MGVISDVDHLDRSPVTDFERAVRDAERKRIRQFETGATRDTDEGKLDYEGFLSPVVLQRFAECMHQHRIQSDGSLRSADNWQKGIPEDAYMKSLFRHFMDVWLHHRGQSNLAGESYQEALCAMMFNIQGLLFEVLREGVSDDEG